MSFNPSAPPPSYDELTEMQKYSNENPNEAGEYENSYEPQESESKPTNSEIGFALQLQTNPYAYSHMCLNSPCLPPQSLEIQPIQTQPIVVQPQVIQGTGLISNPDGTYDFGPYPCRVVCPECHKTSQTRIKYKNSGFTHILAGLLCILGCCCLAPLPYCIKSCKNSVHHCGECGKYLGTFVNGYSVSRYQKYNKRPRNQTNG